VEVTDQEAKDAFEHKLRESPYDRDTRLVYSDWLEEHGEDEYAAWHRAWTPEWQRAKEWLTEFSEVAAEGWDVQTTFDAIIQAGHDYLDKDGETTQIGDSLGFGACNQLCSRDEINEFWKNWSTYTRRPIDDVETLRNEPFSCCSWGGP
jgi:uncharacterized protein (TIGR02996 family)